MVMKPYTPYRNPESRSARRLVWSSLLVVSFALGFLGPDAGGLYAHTEDHSGHKGHDAKSSKTIGATVYKHMCTFCHGEDGNGGGKAIDYLYPWPRDFSQRRVQASVDTVPVLCRSIQISSKPSAKASKEPLCRPGTRP